MRNIMFGGAALTALAGVAAAQTPGPVTSVDEIVVTGTREVGRTQYESLAPVDVLSDEAIEQSVSDDLADVLAQLIPSFNVQRLPAADGLIFVRPAVLRNLSPDQTLVLVNGKRFHRSALIGSRGAQGADLNQIPSFAIKRIEVLRDGASAQYGSDAIAGVINIILDDQPGFRAFAQTSQYFEGDGQSNQFGLQGGLELGDGGYLVATLQWAEAGATSRTRQRPDAIAFQAANPTLQVPNPVQRWGQPDLESLRIAVNAAVPMSATAEAYGFLTYGEGEGVSDFNWRNPAATGNVYRNTTIFPGFNFSSIYPAGFTPRFGQEDEDLQLLGGVRGGPDGFTWDFSASRGRNEITYVITETVNASLGPSSPTAFRPGVLVQQEVNLNADFVWRVEAGLASPVNIAFGGERREERYEIEAGDEASWIVGPGAAQGLASGSNGFPGYSADQAGRWDQVSFAGYVDVEAALTNRWTVAAAVRFEDFSEFGDNTDGKLSTRFDVTPDFAVRASASTGFRAPTPGQLNSTRTSQGLNTATRTIFTAGRLSPLNAVAQRFGAVPLQPEESETISLGATLRTGWGFSGSIDAYRIDLTDRFSQSPSFTVTPAIRAELAAQGIPGAESFTSVSFFTNDFDTRTTGIDLVGEYRRDVGPGSLQLTAAYNYNETEVTRGALTTSATQTRIFEEARPKHNATGSVSYTFGRFELQGRFRYYGKWLDVSGNATGDIFQSFGAITLVDASADVDLSDRVSLRIGAENLFDTYPDEATNQAVRGLIYSRNAPYDTDGGQYYVRLTATF